jgi:subtilisin family serine protease
MLANVKVIVLVVTLATLLVGGSSPPSGAAKPTTAPGESPHVQERDETLIKSNEFLIKLTPDAQRRLQRRAPARTGLASVDAIARRFAVQEVRPVVPIVQASSPARAELERWYVVRLPGPEAHINLSSREELFSKSREPRFQALVGSAQALRGDSNVERVEPATVVKSDLVPNDAHFGSGLLWGLDRISAATAWDTTTGSAQVTVAVLDSGVDYEHADLADRIWTNPGESGLDQFGADKQSNQVDDDGNGYVDDWHGWNFVDGDNNPRDRNAHGTHVAGTIAASGDNDPDHEVDNGTRVVGVAWNARIMPLKFLTGFGVGSDANAAAGVAYAADNGARIVNMSFGGPGVSPVLDDALRYAHDEKDVVLVAAAGNDNVDAYQISPANSPYVITVAASNQADAKSCFSNFGVRIDVAAPGGDAPDCGGEDERIVSLLSSRLDPPRPEQLAPDTIPCCYLAFLGTSMAAPHVSGLAALIRSIHPEFTNEQARQVIRLTADDVGPSQFDVGAGYGRINAAQAVAQTQAPPSAKIQSPRGNDVFSPPTVSVSGIALAAGGSYEIAVGLGVAPTSWTLVTSGPASVASGPLANFDVRQVGFTFPTNFAAKITIRLRVSAGGVVSEDRVLMTYDHHMVAGWPQPLGGSVTSPMLLQPAFADLDNDGKSEVIALALFRGFGFGADVQAWRTDGSIVAGSWPAPLDAAALFPSRPVVADLDGNAGAEVAVLSLNLFSQSLHLFRADGSPMPGWPITWDPDPSSQCFGPNSQTPAPVDVNGDGRNELVVQCLATLFAIDTVTQQIHWQQAVDHTVDGFAQPSWASPAVRDLDGDGQSEIVVAGMHQLYVLRKDGTPYPGWPRTFTDVIGSAPAIADLDQNGAPEIIFVEHEAAFGDARVHAIRLDGTALPGWPVEAEYSLGEAGPIVADLDGDGYPEVIVKGQTIRVHDRLGAVQPGWESLGLLTHGSFETATVGDVDDDGRPEILVADGTGFLGNNRGLKVHKRFTGVIWSRDYGKATAPPVAGDFDGDGNLEIAGGMEDAYSHTQRFFMWKFPSTNLPRQRVYWPQYRFDAEHIGHFQMTGVTGTGVDSDLDGFSDTREAYLGTNPLDGCGPPVLALTNNNPSLTWPADLHTIPGPLGPGLRQITIQDVTSFLAPVRRLDAVAGQPNYHVRWDLTADGAITMDDLNIVIQFMQHKCNE